MELQLNLFGAFSAKNCHGQEISFRDDKVRALLAYLVVEYDRPHRRASLVEMFWGESPEPRARQSLRMALTRLRQSLGEVLTEQNGNQPFLEITRQSVQIHPKTGLHDIDIIEFDQLATQCEEYQAADLENNPFVREWMMQAVTLYRGDFLAGFTLADSPHFDDWLLLIQGRYEQKTLAFLDTLTEDALDHKQLQHAERYAQQQLEISPWLESAHRQLMRLYAQRGQVQLAERQYQRCVQILKSELGLRPEPETEQLFGQIKREQIRPQPPNPAAQPAIIAEVPNNLPRKQTPFFGREVERGKIIRSLLDDRYSVISIVGPGGVGKTRLSVDTARHILHQPAFTDGVWFVPLEGLRGDDENLYETIATTIAAVLDIELVHPIDPHEQLFDFLQSKKMLLILDNFEQLIAEAGDGVDFVLDLLQHATKVKIVVSSRRPLDIQLETTINLDGLPVPEYVDENAYTYSSVQLFVERSQRANQRFALNTETLPDVVKICQLTAGMPLGLELVAVRLREMNLRQIIQALNTNLDLLKTRMRDLPARHRGLRAVFDWSWALLNDDEKRVVSELSVFRGSFSLEAVQTITEATPELLYALISHSLVRTENGRYSLHELLRQYAAEKLDQLEQVQARHCGYYLQFVQDRADALIRKNLAESTQEIQQEWENIHQAWNSAIESQDLHLLNLATTGLGHYLRNSGMLWIGTKLFEAAIKSLEMERPEKRTPYWEHTLGQLKLELARSLFWSAQYEICISNAQQVLEIGEILKDAKLIAGGKLEMGRACWRLGEYNEAQMLLEQALQRSPEDPWLIIQTLNALGNTSIVRGMINEATLHYQRALTLQKEANIWSERVQVLNNLATISAYQGDLYQTIALLSEILSTSKKFNQQIFQVTIYHNLGLAYCETGQFAQSVNSFDQALTLSHKLQNRQIETEIWLGLAQLYRRLGQLDRSQGFLQEAFSLCYEFGEKMSEFEALMQQALLDYQGERFDDALKNSVKSLQISTELGPTEIDMDVLITKGYCSLTLGQFEDARVAYQKAHEISERLVNPIKKAEALTGLAQAHLKLGDQSKVREYLDEIWTCYQERGSLMGTILPYHLYQHLFYLFSALEDPRSAKILRDGKELLRTQSEAIADPEMRQIFLDQPVCHQILCL